MKIAVIGGNPTLSMEEFKKMAEGRVVIHSPGFAPCPHIEKPKGMDLDKRTRVFPNISIDATKITQSILANQLALNFNHEIKLTNYYKRNLKGVLNKAQAELIQAEAKEYDSMFEQKEVTASEVYGTMEGMVKELAALGIMHFGEVTQLLKAYRKDPSSIQGIVNKINR